MSLSATVRTMAQAGCTPDQIAAVVEAYECAEIEKTEARRVKDAERKRRQRHAESRDVTRASEDATDTEIKKEMSPTPPERKNPPSKENPPKGGQKKGSPLSPDWAPNPADWAEAVRTLGEPRAKLELSKFRDHWLSVGGRKVDWDATWRNWFRKAPDFAPRFGSAAQLAASIVKPHIRESLVWVEEGSADWSLWMRARPGYVKSQQEERSENGKALVGAYLPSAQPVKQGVAA